MDFKNVINQLAWKSENKYNFSIPEVKENTNTNYIPDNNLNLSKNVLPIIFSNLEYIKTRFNTTINSDIIIRKFMLSARNKQYKAFLLFIDGMVDSNLINDFILKPLMLKNAANSFNGDQDRIISESVTNHVTIRKVKKFDLVEYVSNCLLPQTSLLRRIVNSEKLIIEDIKVGDITKKMCCLLFRKHCK